MTEPRRAEKGPPEQATMLLNVFYDHDVMVQITDNTAPNGVNGLGRRVSLTQQFLLKYSLVF